MTTVRLPAPPIHPPASPLASPLAFPSWVWAACHLTRNHGPTGPRPVLPPTPEDALEARRLARLRHGLVPA